MEDVNYVSASDPVCLQIVQEQSGWEMELFGMGRTVVVTPAKGDLPNRFWRLMQYIWFGNKWIKLPK